MNVAMLLRMGAALLCTLACASHADSDAPAKGAATKRLDAQKNLAVVELDEESQIKWTVKTAEVAIPLTIEARGKYDLNNLDLTMTQFGGTGQPVDALIDGVKSTKQLDAVKRGKPRTVTISATLRSTGTYRAYLRIGQGGTLLLSAMIEVVRVHAAAPIEVDSIPAQIVDVVPWGSGETAKFSAWVRGTDDWPSLAPPSVKSQEYREAATSTTSIAAPGIAVKVSDPQKTFEVHDQSVPVRIDVSEIKEPGRYDIALSLGNPDYTSVSIPLTFYVRQSYGIAIAWIFGGVLISFFLRFYGVIGRPLLINKQRVTTLLRELDEYATRPETDQVGLALVQTLRRQLTDYWNTLSVAGRTADTAGLDVFDAKVSALPAWLQLRERVVHLQPAYLRTAFEVQLNTVETVLRNGQATTADLAAQGTTLDNMPATIDRAIRDAIKEQLDKFAARLPSSTRFDAIRTQLVDVENDLDAGRLTAAAEKLDRLQLRYIRVVADDLSVALDSTPAGVSTAEWTSTASSIADSLRLARNASTATDALAAFQQALTLYLRVATKGLAADVAERIKKGSAHAAEYRKVGAVVKEAMTLLDEGKLTDAWEKLNVAQQQYRDVRVTAGATLGETATIATAASIGDDAAAASEFDILSIFRGPGSITNRAARMTSQRVLQVAVDLLLTAVILVAAVLLGLQTLWIGNLTWGGWHSWIAALLWGLAFDQFTHAGLIGLIKKT